MVNIKSFEYYKNLIDKMESGEEKDAMIAFAFYYFRREVFLK